MATTFPCSRCQSPLSARLPPPVTVVCPSCHLAHVAWPGEPPRKLEELPVPAAPSGSVRLGAAGELDGVPYQVVGRRVLSQGKARWSEWALLTRTGAVHFISEAQGTLHLMKLRGKRPAAPSPASLAVGARLELEPGEVFHVKERGEALLVAAEGELPLELRLGMRSAFADLEAVGGALGTLDWDDGLDQPPDLWDGYPITAPELGLGQGSPGGRSFACPQCGTARTLVLGDGAATVGCQQCGGLSHREDGGWVLKGRETARLDSLTIPLGSKGTLLGETLVLAGFRRMACTVEGETYCWQEYFGIVTSTSSGAPETRHRWLVEQDGHWSYLAPLTRGDVQWEGSSVRYQSETFREFSTVRAVVEQVQGEQPFATGPGDSARTSDLVCPPRMISLENTGNEEFWTLGMYVTPQEVQQAFNVREPMPLPEGIAPNQPNSAWSTGAWLGLLTLVFAALIIAIYVGVSSGAARQVVFDGDIQPAPPPVGDAAQSADPAFYSAPFTITRGHRNVKVLVQAPELDNDWVSVDVALVHEASGEVRGTTVNLEYYRGVDEGTSWSEGERAETAYLADVPAGEVVLRVDADCQAKPCKRVHVNVSSDMPRPLYAFLLLFLLVLFPLLTLAWAQYQETQRWMNSTKAVE